MEATTNDANAAMAELIATWHSAQVDFIALAEALDEDHWRSASACPGWTNGDVVAHGRKTQQRLVHQRVASGTVVHQIGVDDKNPHRRRSYNCTTFAPSTSQFANCRARSTAPRQASRRAESAKKSSMALAMVSALDRSAS